MENNLKNKIPTEEETVLLLTILWPIMADFKFGRSVFKLTLGVQLQVTNNLCINSSRSI